MQMTNPGCALNDPYPALTDVAQDNDAALLVQQDYASALSEMTALAEYMYQHSVLTATYPEIADTLECIAITEMNHATLLADAIRRLGGDPCYRVEQTTGDRWWNGADVDYGRLVKDALKRDIAAEQAAAAQYRYHADVASQPQLSALLRRIALDEEYHAGVLRGLLRGLSET
ncbi:MAG: ferritin family protein [Oscillospiraceae bacterium]|nr:ferritin family protein [Oscillospiraceae bacterium]